MAESPTTAGVNSKPYWERRFVEDWDVKLGRVQSRFFGELAMQMMPGWLKRGAKSGNWSVVDWGCADGDGTQVLAEKLGVSVSGVDFSRAAIATARKTYPDLKFTVSNWCSSKAPIGFQADLVFSSNTLEHFHEPWETFESLAARARRFVVLLLPFRERERHFEHFVTFDFDSVPQNLADFALLHASVVDASRLPGTQWPGEQILLVYGRPDEVRGLNLSLSDLNFASTGSVEMVRELDEVRVRASEDAKLTGMLEGRVLAQEKELEQGRSKVIEVSVDRAAWIARHDALKEHADEQEARILVLETDRAAYEARLAEQAQQLMALEAELKNAMAKVVAEGGQRQAAASGREVAERRCAEQDRERAVLEEKINTALAGLSAEREAKATHMASRDAAEVGASNQVRDYVAIEQKLDMLLTAVAARRAQYEAHDARRTGALEKSYAAVAAELTKLRFDQVQSSIDLGEKLTGAALATLKREVQRAIDTSAKQLEEYRELFEAGWLTRLFRRMRRRPTGSRVDGSRMAQSTSPAGVRRSWLPRRFLEVIRSALYLGSKAYRSMALTWYEYQFDEYRRSRRKLFPGQWEHVTVPCTRGQVSVVLPCLNGEDMVAESIESVLAQTYKNFELILVDDGSTDETGEIFDMYAAKDGRIRVIHQENCRLPRSLSVGFSIAKGEYLTWTSADNRMKPQCLARLVESLQSDNRLDMVYADLDIIGAVGEPLCGSDWYQNYQIPRGSEHVHFPRRTGELNTWANNFIGACFVYRARVAYLLRDYSDARFCTEDYDYWMRVNALFMLRHIQGSEPLYEYRFHSNSLTSRDKSLRITENRLRLMVFEDFRRSFLLTRGLWCLAEQSGTAAERKCTARLRAMLQRSGQVILDNEQLNSFETYDLWLPTVCIVVAEKPESVRVPTAGVDVTNVLVAITPKELPQSVDEEWAWCAVLEKGGDRNATALDRPFQGWAVIDDEEQLLAGIDVLAKQRRLSAIEREAEALHDGTHAHDLDATVVICTYRRSAILKDSVRSALVQSISPSRYEIVVVNNEPSDDYPRRVCDDALNELGPEPHPRMRVVDCHVRGLSHARNAGISVSRGRVLWFLDDDAVAQHDCLEHLLNAYENDQTLGIVGGHIVLELPEPKPPVALPGREALWSQFVTGFTECTKVEHWCEFPWGANWSATRETLFAIGGFRTNFGRVGNNFGGGEEVVAAVLANKLGYTVAIQPQACVAHRVERKRFTTRHVRKTVIAGVLANYQMQKSMYLPFESSLPGNTKVVIRDFLGEFNRMFRALGQSRRSGTDDLVESAYRSAHRKLWLQQVTDRFRRLRSPFAHD